MPGMLLNNQVWLPATVLDHISLKNEIELGVADARHGTWHAKGTHR